MKHYNMKNFTLSVATEKRQNPKNTLYETQANITSIDEFREAVQWDNTEGIFKNNYRKESNFISANVVFMDCDNDNNDTPEKWIRPEDIAKKLPDVELLIMYSRHNQKMKHGKSPRPRFHVYFPLSVAVNTPQRLKEIKAQLLRLVPEFDGGAKDAARLFYGVENPQVDCYEGALCVDEFLTISGVNETESGHEEIISTDSTETITVGSRHDTLLQTALEALRRYSENKAREIFDKACLRCKPQKSLEECARIWKWAVETVKDYKDSVRERQKKNLSARDIEETLQALNISVEFDVIRREMRISDLPENHELVPASYYALNSQERRQQNLNQLPLFLQTFFKKKNYGVSEKFITDALNAIGNAHKYNPVLAMLEATAHDGKKRIEQIYSVLGIYDDESYENHIYRSLLKKWLHQSIALALNDNGTIGAEFVLILQGRQGLGKTNFFRHLVPEPDLFKDGSILDIANKDSRIENTMVWINELGELDATMKKEQAALKSFLTAHTDIYRKPYARSAEKVERRTCFCGTVNPDAVIRDATGSRRYVFVHVDDIDKDFIYNVMTPEWAAQLWREVYETLYLPNPKGFYLSDAEMSQNEKINERYTIELEGESELRDLLRWEDDEIPIEEYTQCWKWETLTELKDEVENLKEEKIKSPKIGLAIMRIIRSLGLNPDDFKRRVHGRTQYRLPQRRSKYEY